MCVHDVAMTFQDLQALTRLPYFKREDGRLKLADPSIGKTIDFHTHLSLSYVRPNRIDLHRLHPETQYYLPSERTFHLDRYLNQSFSKEDLSRLKRDLVLGGMTAGGMRLTHTAANLARDMEDLNIKHSVLLPIDFPWISDNAGTWLEDRQGRSALHLLRLGPSVFRPARGAARSPARARRHRRQGPSQHPDRRARGQTLDGPLSPVRRAADGGVLALRPSRHRAAARKDPHPGAPLRKTDPRAAPLHLRARPRRRAAKRSSARARPPLRERLSRRSPASRSSASAT